MDLAVSQLALVTGRPESNRFVADHMAGWTSRQFEFLNQPDRAIQHVPINATPTLRSLGAGVRQQIRDLIERREISFDQITEASVAEWAADLLDDA